ncbi:MAG: mannose/fructose/sorbose PTS transporter subunit IIA [Breznakia sp.]
MVGIILASHGDFAKGMLHSGEMIFGTQENVKAITLYPSEGPDDLREKLLAAVAAFENQQEVLIFVDLYGGTPFNQANGLLKEHEDNWAIVTGMNLPMLIEAFASRTSMNCAHDLATHVMSVAKEGVRVCPERLSSKEATKENTVNARVGAIPEGTVLGDGKIKYGMVRVDSRLLHGQVATAWTKSVKPTRIIVVSDSVAKDELRKNLIVEASPPGVKANVIPIEKMIAIAKDPRFGDTKAMLLFETPQDVLRVIEGGVSFDEINIGSMAHSLGKVAVSKSVSLGNADIDTFEKLSVMGVKFDVRKVPNDARENMNNFIKKAKVELAKL